MSRVSSKEEKLFNMPASTLPSYRSLTPMVNAPELKSTPAPDWAPLASKYVAIQNQRKTSQGHRKINSNIEVYKAFSELKLTERKNKK